MRRRPHGSTRRGGFEPKLRTFVAIAATGFIGAVVAIGFSGMIRG